MHFLSDAKSDNSQSQVPANDFVIECLVQTDILLWAGVKQEDGIAPNQGKVEARLLEIRLLKLESAWGEIKERNDVTTWANKKCVLTKQYVWKMGWSAEKQTISTKLPDFDVRAIKCACMYTVVNVHIFIMQLTIWSTYNSKLKSCC